MSPKAPYGYKKSSDDCHQLIVDPEAAGVVKEIFSMAEKKISLNEIVRRLNLAHVLTPMDYALSKGLKGNYESGDGSWNTRSVKYILTNRSYAGDLLQGKDDVLVENTHEALISRSVFMRIQESYSQHPVCSTTAPTNPVDNPLRGKVICASCGGKMQRRKGSSSEGWYFFSCITNNRKGSGCSTGMYIRESDIFSKIKSELISKRICESNTTRSMLASIIDEHLVEVIVHADKKMDVHFHDLRGDML